MKKIIFLLFVMVGFIFQPLQAQDSQGTDFWLCFPINHTGSTAKYFNISSAVNTSGTISGPGLSTPIPFTVVAGNITKVPLPTTVHIATNDAVTSKGLHITALNDVTVYGFNERTATTDAYLGFPVDALGTEHIVLAYKNTNVVNASQLSLVAAESGTTQVTITPSVTTGARAGGVPYTISLTQGQTYMLMNTVNGGDLSGTIIMSDKKIAVFGGHKCVNIPAGKVACDHIVEQLPPVTAWGKSFVTVPLATRNGDTYRFLAQSTGTIVKVNGVASGPVLNRGDYYEVILFGHNRVTSNLPILLGQYSNSSSYDGVTSDPFFLLVPPTEQFLTSYVVASGTSNIPINYFNIVSEASQTSSVTVDGVTVGAGSWTPIPGTSLSGAQVSTTVGQHAISSAYPIGVSIYGFGSYDSYGYLGGQSFSPVATVSSFSLTLVNAQAQQGQEKCVEATVLDQNNAPVVGVKVDFKMQGANPGLGYDFTDSQGKITFCYFAGNTGQDSVIASIFGLADTVYITVLPSVLTINPATGNINQGAQNCVTAHMVDGGNLPVKGALITFTVTGANPGTTVLSTDGNGNAMYCYTATNTGTDNLSVTSGSLSQNGVYQIGSNNSPCLHSVTFKVSALSTLLQGAGANAPNTYYYGLSRAMSIKPKVVGGTGPYTYAWSNSQGYTIKSNAKGKAALYYPTGPSYMVVEITDVGAGCTIKDSVLINFGDFTCNPPGKLWYYQLCNTVTNQSVCVNTYWNMIDSLKTGNYVFGTCGVPKNNPLFVKDDLSVNVFPNPSDGEFTFIITSDKSNSFTAEVVDLSGRTLYRETIESNSRYTSRVLNLSDFNSGVYLLQVTSQDETIVQRLIVK